ncbi:MAG: ester cyclase [Chloroflexi bacterium]|nr:MAG: ester cyclase [Chloroflexota bacterium]
MPAQQDYVQLYRRFLDAFNAGDEKALDGVLAESFLDHHPGFVVTNREEYKSALRMARSTVEVRGELDAIEAIAGDRVLLRATLSGRHVGAIFDRPPTGRPVSWKTIEIWRGENGRFVERWAQDDLLGLVGQLSDDEENMRVIRRLDDVVNSRKYDDMDELFAPRFIDNNPHQDEVYAASGNRVVIHLTFEGRHVGPFLGAEPTGRPVTWTSIEIYRMEDRKIAERWVQADTTGLMRQLGAPLPVER